MSDLSSAARAQRIGRFVLREPLGRGAQATVWRAYDERLDREVAIKLLALDADADALAEWLNEARAVSRLAHPNIVPVFEADSQGGQPYLVFELVRGETLSAQLKKSPTMAPRAAVALMLPVLQALAAAQAQGIVHRDLKPSNVLIDADGRPRVMDFGIAARAGGGDGRIVGTPGYMSPEAAAGAAPQPAMDVFAAGMMLAQMIAGRPLLAERDPMVALQRVRRERFAMPASVNCDDTLRAAINRALEPDPALRWLNAQALHDALAATAPPAAPAAPAAESASATLDFLLRRMRHKSDFPTLSESIVRIQRIANSDTESLGSLANEILKDVALTHKLLRLVNTAGYSHAGGGSIGTISRAAALIGFAGIRNMALSLVLLEHMQDKAHAVRLREEFVQALMAGQLAYELTPWAREAEEVYVAALLQNLGRLLTEFYFPEEARNIRDALQTLPAPVPADATEAAAVRVLGLGFEELGQGVARAWGLPDGLRQSMRRPEGAPPARAAERGAERNRWVCALANDMASILASLEPEAAAVQVAEAAERHAKLLGVTPGAIVQAVGAARQKLADLAPVMGLHAANGQAARRLLSPAAPTAAKPTDSLSPHVLQATVIEARRHVDPGSATPAEAGSDATLVLPAPAATALGTKPALAIDLLTAGIQDVTHALAAEQFRLNDVLRTIMETLLRALALRRVVFLLKDPRQPRLLGRFGLGEGALALAPKFDVPLVVPVGRVPDLFMAVCAKGADTLIADASESRIRDRLPPWFAAVQANSFLLLPLTMKGAPFALIYADAARRIELDERELTLVRTLRNQALMAFRQQN